MVNSTVIVDAVRTPSGRGKPGGALSALHPVDLLAQTLRALTDRVGLDPALVEDVIGGCVSQVGEQAVNVTRNAVLAAGFPESVPAVTVDRQCGSSQQAASFAAQGVIAGAYDVVIACGVELMSHNPIGSAVAGADPYGPLVAERFPAGLVHQGISAELIARQWGISRTRSDEFAARSHALAAAADFGPELIEVHRPDGSTVTTDETVRPATTAAGLAELRPSFADPRYEERFGPIDWQITPGNASPLTDGASAVLIMAEDRARQLGFTPRARFHSFAVTGSDPLLMLTGVIPATELVLKKAGLSLAQVDTYEVNEAFAPVPLAWLDETGADPDRLNPRGGAIALGHPLGASGTKLLTTMITTLEQTGGRYGLQTMCEGGGMANATIIERL